LHVHAVAGEAGAVGSDGELGHAEHALDADVAGALDAAHGVADRLAEPLELEQVGAGEHDLHVRARAADHLVGAVLDRLGDREEGRGHLALERGLEGHAEAVEVVGGGPVLLGLEADDGVVVVLADRVDGDLGAAGHARGW
jgi:hypothetical protein